MEHSNATLAVGSSTRTGAAMTSIAPKAWCFYAVYRAASISGRTKASLKSGCWLTVYKANPNLSSSPPAVQEKKRVFQIKPMENPYDDITWRYPSRPHYRYG